MFLTFLVSFLDFRLGSHFAMLSLTDQECDCPNICLEHRQSVLETRSLRAEVQQLFQNLTLGGVITMIQLFIFITGLDITDSPIVMTI